MYNEPAADFTFIHSLLSTASVCLLQSRDIRDGRNGAMFSLHLYVLSYNHGRLRNKTIIDDFKHLHVAALIH